MEKGKAMSKLVLQLTDTYLLHFTLSEWNDTRTLTIESQWTGAKDPDGLQRRYQVTLEKDQWDEVIDFLKGGDDGQSTTNSSTERTVWASVRS